MATKVDLTRSLLGLYRDGYGDAVEWKSGPPPRIDGYTIGYVSHTPGADPPHAGEMHPDGDEILVLVSGQIDLVLENWSGHENIPVFPGQAVVVPRGVWHRVTSRQPGRLLHITPGPGGEWRPLRQERAR
jgi:mannose-6-phosphate isomerase-like protein (cupin superfamily)